MLDRYLIEHPQEGLIGSASKKAEALAIALVWSQSNTGYDDAAEAIRVYDRMAHFGSPNEWNIKGRITGRKKQETTDATTS